MARLLILAALMAVAAPARAGEPAPRIEVTPSSLSFDRPGAQQVTIRNVGEGPLSIQGARVLNPTSGGSFSTDPLAGGVLAPGKSVVTRVIWTADARQTPGFGALLITADDPRLPQSHDGGRVATVALRAGAGAPLLSLIVFFPLLGIPLCFLVPARRAALARWIALGVSAVPLALALLLVSRFDPSFGRAGGNDGLQFVEHYTWIHGFNVEYFLGVDGISVTMLLLSTLISVVAVGASWSVPAEQHGRGYFALLLLLQVGMAGVFCALDFFLFFIFWEVMLLPMYFLIGIWGGPRKEYAAIKFFLYTLLGGVLLLLGIIALYYASQPTYLVDGTPAAHTFDMMKLAHENDFAGERGILGVAFPKLVWLLFFVGFAIKIPSVPLHTWLPDAHVEAPTAISVILAGVLLKMGTYGLMRVNWPILPEATRWAADGVALVGVVSILWGAFCAMAQTDLKRLVAYSSVSHMGFCLLGMAALTPTGMNGALFQMWSHGVVTSMLFLLVGVLYDRTHTRGLTEFGGVATVMPRYAAVFGLAFMASLGLPGLSGFIGEFLVFVGAFGAYRGLVVLAGLSLVLTAAYHLWAIQRVQLGPFNERWREALTGRDLTPREALTLLPLAALVIVLGFWPAPILGLIATGAQDLVTTVNAAAASLGTR